MITYLFSIYCSFDVFWNFLVEERKEEELKIRPANQFDGSRNNVVPLQHVNKPARKWAVSATNNNILDNNTVFLSRLHKKKCNYTLNLHDSSSKNACERNFITIFS